VKVLLHEKNIQIFQRIIEEYIMQQNDVYGTRIDDIDQHAFYLMDKEILKGF